MSPLELSDVCLQCGGKLQQSLSGSAVDVFSKTLRGLAATKLTKPSAFRTADGAGYAVRCSYKVSHTCSGQLTISQGVHDPIHASKSAQISCPEALVREPLWNNLVQHQDGVLQLPMSGSVAAAMQILENNT